MFLEGKCPVLRQLLKKSLDTADFRYYNDLVCAKALAFVRHKVND